MLQVAIGKLFTDRENPRRQDLKGVIYTNLDLGAVDRLTSKIGTLVNLDASPRRFNSSGRAVRPGQQVDWLFGLLAGGGNFVRVDHAGCLPRPRCPALLLHAWPMVPFAPARRTTRFWLNRAEPRRISRFCVRRS